jgi:hypothetical protein
MAQRTMASPLAAQAPDGFAKARHRLGVNRTSNKAPQSKQIVFSGSRRHADDAVLWVFG